MPEKLISPKIFLSGSRAIVTLLLSVNLTLAQSNSKYTVPNPTEQKPTRNQIKNRFRSYYQQPRTTSATWERLATSLLTEADKQSFNRITTFVRLDEARLLGIKAGDVGIALAAIDSIDARYKINKHAYRSKTYAALVDRKLEPSALRTLSDIILQDIRDARSEDDYEQAIALAKIAVKAAANTKALPLVLKARRVKEDVVAAKQEFAAVAPFVEVLKKDPTNAKANREVGNYVCLRKGRWKHGLFLLAQGDDEQLRSLAQRDLAEPQSHKDQLQLGHSWWKLADKKDGLVKTRLRQRAAYWYQEALDQADEKLRKALETRIAMVPPIPGAIPAWDYFGKPGLICQGSNPRNIYSVAFAPDGKSVTTGCSGDDVIFWNAKTAKQQKKFSGHTSTIWGQVFSRDGRYVYSASSDGSVRKWDVRKGREVLRMPKGRFGNFYGIDLSPDGRRVLAGCSNGMLMMFDTQTGKKLKTLNGHRGTIYGVKFFDNGRKAVSGSSGNQIIIWDLTTGRPIKTISTRSTVRSVAVTPDGRHVLASEYSSILRMWDIRTGKVVRQFTGHSGSVYTVAIAPDGKRLATAVSGGGRIYYWDLRTGKQLRIFRGHTGTIYDIAFSPGGGRLVSGSSDNKVCVWGLPRHP